MRDERDLKGISPLGATTKPGRRPKTLSRFRPDLFRSLIQTCELCGADPSAYLIELQKHTQELAKHPAAWVPRNYRETLAQSGSDVDSGSDLS